MHKIVILGCENSHANIFLNLMKTHEEYKDMEVLGVYSVDEAAAKKLSDEFGVPVMKAPDEMVGKVDGIVVTARHGKYHLPFARPYLEAGIKAMFLDKPLTITKEDALEVEKLLKEHGTSVNGGSCCKFIDEVQLIGKHHRESKDGKTIGGTFRAPVSLHNDYGDFHFYCQHLIDMVVAAYGFPHSVLCKNWGDRIDVEYIYDEFMIHGMFVENHYIYTMGRHAEEGREEYEVSLSNDSECFKIEFAEFHDLLNGAPQHMSTNDFFASVAITNAIEESMNENKLVKIDYKGYRL